MLHTKHIWRAVLLLVGAAVVGFTGRHFMIPESFGEAGFYRYDSLGDFMAKPVVHGGSASCAECHAEQATTKAEGKHAGLSCEACHGPLAGHVKDGVRIAPMPVNRSHELCAYCHQALKARPATMPQVDIPQHLLTLEVLSPGDAIPEGACATCHDVHSPVGSETEEAPVATTGDQS